MNSDSQSHYRVVGIKGWLEMRPATVYRRLRMRVHHDSVTEESSLPVLETIQALVREVAMSGTQFSSNKRATREKPDR